MNCYRSTAIAAAVIAFVAGVGHVGACLINAVFSPDFLTYVFGVPEVGFWRTIEALTLVIIISPGRLVNLFKQGDLFDAGTGWNGSEDGR